MWVFFLINNYAAIAGVGQYVTDYAASVGTFVGAAIAAWSSRQNGYHLKRLRATEHKNANVLNNIVLNLAVLRNACEKIKPGCVTDWIRIEPADRQES